MCLCHAEEGCTGWGASIAGRIGGDDAEAQLAAAQSLRHVPRYVRVARADLESHPCGEGRDERTVFVDADDGAASAAVVEEVEVQGRWLAAACRSGKGRN